MIPADKMPNTRMKRSIGLDPREKQLAAGPIQESSTVRSTTFTGPPPRLTFVIPVRNDAARLRDCLNSIHASAQCSEIEILVVDNGSPDNSVEVARKGDA